MVFRLILGLFFGLLLWISANNEDQMRARMSYDVYYDEDNLMEDLEEWILVEDLEEGRIFQRCGIKKMRCARATLIITASSNGTPITNSHVIDIFLMSWGDHPDTDEILRLLSNQRPELRRAHETELSINV